MKKNIKKGFTLIEVLVAAMIFVGVVIIGVGSFTASTGTQRRTENIRELGQESRYAMEKISREVRIAPKGTKKYIISTDMSQDVEGYFVLDDDYNVTEEGNKLVVFEERDNNDNYANIYRLYTNPTTQRKILQVKNVPYPDPDQIGLRKTTVQDNNGYQDITNRDDINVINTSDMPLFNQKWPVFEVGYVDPDGDEAVTGWNTLDGNLTYFDEIYEGIRQPVAPDLNNQIWGNGTPFPSRAIADFTMEPLPVAEMIPKIVVWVWCGRNNQLVSDISGNIKTASGWQTSKPFNCPVAEGRWRPITYTNTNMWHQEDINNLQVRIEQTTSVVGWFSVSAMYAEIHYSTGGAPRQPSLEINLNTENIHPVRTVTGAITDKLKLKTTVTWRQYE